MRTQALLVADDPVYRSWLAECLGDDVAVLPADATEPAGLVAEITSTPGVGLLFVQFDEEHAQERGQLVELILDQYPELPVVAVGDSEQSDAVLAAMRAGTRDYFVLNRDDDNLQALVAKVLKRTPSTPANAGGSTADGKLYSVISSLPVAGVPFLAVHLTIALQTAGGEMRRVLLVDMTSPGGAALVFLDTEQAYSALDALRDVYRCDQTLIDTAFTRHENGYYLLSLPEDSVGPPDLEVDDFARLLQTLKNYFDYIVVSADSGIGLPAVNALVYHANRNLLITDQSVLRSRQNKHLLHALRQADCPLDRSGLVIDHYQTNLGLDADRIASLLDLELVATLTGKPLSRIESMNSGEPLFESAPRDAYCREVSDLVRRFTGETVEAAKPTGLLGRFLR